MYVNLRYKITFVIEGKIIDRLPYCLQYVLCGNSATRTNTTLLNIQNSVQHHRKHFVLHAQQTIKLFAIFNIVFNTKLPINRYLGKGYLNVCQAQLKDSIRNRK